MQQRNKAPRLEEQLHIGSERTSGRIFRKVLMLKIVKRRVEPFPESEC
jgi:hypothetical protein